MKRRFLSPRHSAPSGYGWRNGLQYEACCESVDYAVADSRQGVVLQLGGWAKCQRLLALKRILLRNIDTEILGPGLTLRYNISNEKGTWYLVLRLWGVNIGQGHLTTAASELARYELDVEVYRKLGGIQQRIIFFLWKRKRKSSIGNRIFSTPQVRE